MDHFKFARILNNQNIFVLNSESGIPKWFFEEMQFLSEQQFENKEQERAQQYVTNISNWLHLYPPQDVLIGDYIFTKFTPEVIKKVLRYLNPDNVRVTILTKNCRYFASQVRSKNEQDWTCVIHLARPTVSPVANIVFA